MNAVKFMVLDAAKTQQRMKDFPINMEVKTDVSQNNSFSQILRDDRYSQKISTPTQKVKKAEEPRARTETRRQEEYKPVKPESKSLDPGADTRKLENRSDESRRAVHNTNDSSKVNAQKPHTDNTAKTDAKERPAISAAKKTKGDTQNKVDKKEGSLKADATKTNLKKNADNASDIESIENMFSLFLKNPKAFMAKLQKVIEVVRKMSNEEENPDIKSKLQKLLQTLSLMASQMKNVAAQLSAGNLEALDKEAAKMAELFSQDLPEIGKAAKLIQSVLTLKTDGAQDNDRQHNLISAQSVDKAGNSILRTKVQTDFGLQNKGDTKAVKKTGFDHSERNTESAKPSTVQASKPGAKALAEFKENIIKMAEAHAAETKTVTAEHKASDGDKKVVLSGKQPKPSDSAGAIDFKASPASSAAAESEKPDIQTVVNEAAMLKLGDKDRQQKNSNAKETELKDDKKNIDNFIRAKVKKAVSSAASEKKSVTEPLRNNDLRRNAASKLKAKEEAKKDEVLIKLPRKQTFLEIRKKVASKKHNSIPADKKTHEIKDVFLKAENVFAQGKKSTDSEMKIGKDTLVKGASLDNVRFDTGSKLSIDSKPVQNVSTKPQLNGLNQLSQKEQVRIVKNLMSQLNLNNAKDGVVSTKIQLHPEHLGKLDVRIEIQKGVVKAQFVAETQSVKQAIESNFSSLNQQFSDNGLSLGEFSVNINNGNQNGGDDSEQNDEKVIDFASKSIEGDEPSTAPEWSFYDGINRYNIIA